MLPEGLPRLTIRQLARLLESGALTSQQLSSFCYTLAQAGEQIWNLNAFAYLLPKEHVMEQAEQSDRRRRQSRSRSLLDGIPVSIKANIAVDFLPLTAGSRIIGAHCPGSMPLAGYNADVTESLLVYGGAVCMGSTSMDEFGMGSLGTNVVTDEGIRPTKNPTPYILSLGKRAMSDDELLSTIYLEPDAILEAHLDAKNKYDDGPTFSAGGSSCGSATSVAHGSSVVSLGTDTGGSVRLPASWCNIVGLKPTYGLLSRHGLVSYASSLDCPGILATSADCAAITLDNLLQQSSVDRDSTTDSSPKRKTFQEDVRQAARKDAESVNQPLLGIKIGIPAAFSIEECPEFTLDAWQETSLRLESLGATVEAVQTDSLTADVLKQALSAYYVLACAEASSNLARYDGLRYGLSVETEDCTLTDSSRSVLEQQYAVVRSVGFGNEVSRRILSGAAVLSSDRFHTYYEAAAKMRSNLTRQFQGALNSYDVLLVPTVVFPPVLLDQGVDATEMLANDIMTVPVSLAGLPAVSVCSTNSDENGFSPGMQLIGSRLGEDIILRTAIALQAFH